MNSKISYKSPIFKLESAMRKAPFRIAPERASELATWIDEYSIRFKYEFDEKGVRGFNIRVLTQEKIVAVSVSSLEYLWASVRAQLSFYKGYMDCKEEEFDWMNLTRTRESVELLNWANENIHSNIRSQWPDKLPSPQDGNRSPDDTVVEETFLCSFSWILHHELAHLRLEHTWLPTSRSIHEEIEADGEATSWIVNERTPKEQVFKRAMSAAAALIALTELPETTNGDYQRTHPEPSDRLDLILESFGFSDHHEIYRFTAIALQSQLARRGIQPSMPSGSFKDIYSEYLLLRAKAGKTHSLN